MTKISLPCAIYTFVYRLFFLHILFLQLSFFLIAFPTFALRLDTPFPDAPVRLAPAGLRGRVPQPSPFASFLPVPVLPG